MQRIEKCNCISEYNEDKEGSLFLWFIYSDRATSFTGKADETIIVGGCTETVITNCNFMLKKGWNEIASTRMKTFVLLKLSIVLKLIQTLLVQT